MPLSHGADAARLHDIGADLGTSAERLATLGTTGDSLVATTREAWAGPDMEQFVADWEASRHQLRSCTERLTAFARELLVQAREQEQGSSGAGGGVGGDLPAGTKGGSPLSAAASLPTDVKTAEDRGSTDRGPGEGGRPTGPRPPGAPPPLERGPDGIVLPRGLSADDPIVEELASTPTGRETLTWLADNDIRVWYDDDLEGAYYQPALDSITLGKDQYRDGQTLVHEANHARWDLDDKAADVDDVSRNTYIQSEYDEETAGTVEAIQHAKERRADLGYAQYTESERRYDEGYDRGYNGALERGRSPQLAHQAGESAGREAVRDRFSSGDSRSSDGGQTYGERAGETWDAENDWNPFNGI